jgi:hypothetical protein
LSNSHAGHHTIFVWSGRADATAVSSSSSSEWTISNARQKRLDNESDMMMMVRAMEPEYGALWR